MAFEGDRNHERAKELLTGESELATSDHVLVETWLLINSRFGRHYAEVFWRGIRTGRIETLIVTAADLEAARLIAEQFADQNFSIVDLTSFAIMTRQGLTRAASFDHHFSVFRFGENRDRAFEVSR